LDQLEAILDDETVLSDRAFATEALSESQQAALAYADWMTKNVHVPQHVFEAVKTHFNEQQVVEITLTVSTYNMVSRILIALDVGDKAETAIPRLNKN
jgi:4-carboxymuconolactone decarboxylase